MIRRNGSGGEHEVDVGRTNCRTYVAEQAKGVYVVISDKGGDISMKIGSPFDRNRSLELEYRFLQRHEITQTLTMCVLLLHCSCSADASLPES